MSGRLHNKRAFITAAGQGIGRAITDRFIAEGASVIATDIDASKLSDISGAECHALDICDTSAVNSLATSIGEIDILANIAGYVHHGTILDCSESDWDFSFNLNVTSMHRTISAFLPMMISSGGGSIINMSSIVSSLKGAPNRYVYAASKAAILGLTRSIATDFIKDGIRCNAICPGTVESPSWHERVSALGEELGDKSEAMRSFIDRQAMGRVGKASEIADLAVYLASDESTFTTGIAHPIDGGFSL